MPAIVQAGHLRPGSSGVSIERPMLWFSANQVWEPTAGKAWRGKDGRLSKAMTFREQQSTVGCVRFGLASRDLRLIEWRDACAVAGIPRDDRRRMERNGQKAGGDPSQWMAVAGAVELSDLSFEVFGDGAWHYANADEMAHVWDEHFASA